MKDLMRFKNIVMKPQKLLSLIIIGLIEYHRHQSVLPKGRSFTESAGILAAVLPKAGLPPQIQEPRL